MPIEETLCPKCGKRMIPRLSTFGKFWGCVDYPKCKGSRNSLGDPPKGDEDDEDGKDE